MNAVPVPHALAQQPALCADVSEVRQIAARLIGVPGGIGST
jgi:hypothetical protein